LSAVGVRENAGRAGEDEGAESGRCENEVCEMGTNLAGIVIASAKRHGERELKKEESSWNDDLPVVSAISIELSGEREHPSVALPAPFRIEFSKSMPRRA